MSLNDYRKLGEKHAYEHKNPIRTDIQKQTMSDSQRNAYVNGYNNAKKNK